VVRVGTAFEHWHGLRSRTGRQGSYAYASYTIKVAAPNVVLFNGAALKGCTVVDEKDWTCSGMISSSDGRLSMFGIGEQIGPLKYWLGKNGFLGQPSTATDHSKPCAERWGERKWPLEDFKRVNEDCVLWLESKELKSQ
jgi:hypothetical protein